MMLLPQSRRADLIVKDLAEETLVYDRSNDKAYCLNSVTALVWKHCDGKTTAAEMGNLLSAELKTAIEVDVVSLALQELQKVSLLEDTTPSQLPKVSRRGLIVKYGPMALLLPAIISLGVPTAQAQGSCAGQGEDCLTRPCCPGLTPDSIPGCCTCSCPSFPVECGCV